MTQRLNEPAGKFKVLFVIGSLQWLLVVSDSRRIYTEDSVFDPVWIIQMDHNTNGSDEYASNIC